MNLTCDDGAELYLEQLGEGPDVVLLHPFPCDHRFWLPAAQHWQSRFRLLMPDLRGLGRSSAVGEITTMRRMAEDVERLCDKLQIGRAVFVGCSVGGYVLFELWRRSRERFQAVVLMDTRASVDSDEARAGRLKNADETLLRGPGWAIEQMMPRMLSPVTLGSRADVVEQARATMLLARASGMAAMQRGMAAREDSTATLAGIDVPTLVLGGEDDLPSPVAELQKLAAGIRGAEFKIIARAGHLAALEQPAEVGRVVRAFLERHRRQT
jgi:pimeloyl-ACP methyl ester carboxylesterase